MAISSSDIQVELVENEEDVAGFWNCMYQAFGMQTKDAFFNVLYPNIYTPDGYAAAVGNLTDDWLKDGKDSTTNFWLKATVPDTDGTEKASISAPRKIVGAAIWIEALHGRNSPSNDVTKYMNLEEVYPGNEREQTFLRQLYTSLYSRRVKVVEEAGQEERPVMILDVCCILPEYQGLRIGRKLVQWGLDRASRQGESYGGGTLECYTEASKMGRPVYERMGFKPDGDVVYVVDDEFKGRPTAPNTQLRRPRGLAV